MGSFTIWAAFFISVSLLSGEIDALSKHSHWYKEGEGLNVEFNSLTSDKSIFPLNFYDLPHCSSKPSEIKESPLNLGQILMGDKLQSSPFYLKMNINESFVHICDTNPLSASQIQQFGKAIDQNYHYNMYLDGLPAMSPEPPTFRKPWIGSPVGFRDFYTYYIFNHMKLKILVRRSDEAPNSFAIVGFEADPCPCCHQRRPFIGPHIYAVYRLPVICDGFTFTRELIENETVSFSYEVAFEESPLEWESRWDPYVDSKSSVDLWASLAVQWVICLLFWLLILYKTRRTKERNEERALLPSSEIAISYPPFPMALSVLIGSGVQVLCTTCATLLIGWLGFLSSSSRGSFLTQMAYCHVASAMLSGYTTVRILKAMDPGNTVSREAATWRVASVFPAITAVGLILLNAMQSGGDGTIGVATKLLVVWCASVPLAFYGGHVASRGNRRPITRALRKERGGSWWMVGLCVLLAGHSNYNVCKDELKHTTSRFVRGFYFTDYSYHVMSMMLLVVSWGHMGGFCKLVFGDKWWWGCFIGPSTAALWLFRFLVMHPSYQFGYNVMDSSYQLKHFTDLSMVVYAAYCFLFSLNFMIVVGAVGFFVPFSFSRFH